MADRNERTGEIYTNGLKEYIITCWVCGREETRSLYSLKQAEAEFREAGWFKRAGSKWRCGDHARQAQ